MKKKRFVTGLVAGASALAIMAGLVVTGATVNWGPFAFLHSWEAEVAAIEQAHAPSEPGGKIIFYGASNFARWTHLEDDLGEYAVQNHSFGGSTDADLVQYAERLLYPYDPAIVVLQTGSNDYVGMDGTDAERTQAVLAAKQRMLATFQSALPEAHFVIVSGIPMPGRAEFTPLIESLNDALEAFAGESDHIWFVDAEALTWNGAAYDESMFVADGIHLTREARLAWANDYIVPALDAVVFEHQLEGIHR